MKNPIVLLVRRYVLRHTQSSTPTSLLPMQQIRNAVVYVDGLTAAEDPTVACRLAQRLLLDRGIEVRILCPGKKDLDWIGRIKPERRDETLCDLFLSLADPLDFTAEYEARRAEARFKAGRCALTGGVFDLVASTPRTEQTPAKQADAIPAILEILDKIQ